MGTPEIERLSAGCAFVDGPRQNALHPVSEGDTLTGFTGVPDRREWHATVSIIQGAIQACQMALSL